MAKFSNDILNGDSLKELKKIPDKTFNLVFADPPYDFSKEEFLKIVNLVFERSLLLEDGILIVEHSKHTDLSEHPNYSHEKRYGGNVFSFFELEKDTE